jgi:hypothetical protein
MKGGTELEIFGRGFNASIGTKAAVRFYCRLDLASSFPEMLKSGRILSPFYNEMDAPVPNPNVVRATVLSSSRLKCITPKVSCQGAFDVSVALNGYDFHSDAPAPAGSAPLLFEFYPPLVLHHMQPLGGPTTGNTTVIVSGRGLKAYNESLACRFGPETDEFGNVIGASLDTQTTLGKALSDERFVCQSPQMERPMLVMLSVSLNGVDFDRVSFVPFTFYRAPSVSLLSPAGGPSLGGTQVVVRGQGFLAFPIGGKLMCRFGRTVVPSSNSTTSFKSMCIAPNNSAGTAVVTFSLNGQDYGSRVFFHFYDLPTISHSTPWGGEPSRTPEKSTSVQVYGEGFLRFHGKPLCKFGCALSPAVVQDDHSLVCHAPWPVDSYHLFLDDCSPRQRVLKCETSACTRQGCVPLSTSQVLNISCVLDTWLEVSLNGIDFTSDSNVNYRYFQQPQFLKFGPSGGPRSGNTLIEVFSGPLGGFNRLNDGSLTLLIGGRPVVCEAEPGETVLHDDFDPIPPELQPSKEQMRMILNYTADLEDVLDDNFEAYVVDKQYWQTGEGLKSGKLCGGVAQDALISAIIDPGNEQGFGAKLVNFTDLSAALHFTGKTSDILLGRHALSRSIDVSRGALIQFSVRRGEDKWPNPCEAPEAGDDLLLLIRTEANTDGVEVPAWYDRNLWTVISTFGALDPKLAGSSFVPFQDRINASRHILGTRKPVQNMIDCKRDQPCNTSKGKILLLQPNHGSGPYDVWAVDNLNIIANGGVISDSRIVCRSPATDVLGPAEVSLALNGQQFSTAGAGNPVGQEQFIYYAEPVILSILPSGGPDGGQTVITLVGSGFTNFKDENYPPKCKFGIQTTDAIVMSDSKVICPGVLATVYTGYAEVSIALNGVDFTPGPLVYIYYEQPRLHSLYPNSGPSREGTYVNIIGQGFIYLTPFPSSCKFTNIHDPESMIIMPATYLNNTLIACTTPTTSGWFLNDETSIDAVVEISLNDQQFTSQDALVFTFFIEPTIIKAEQFSTDNKLVYNGGEPLTVYGKKLRKEVDLKCVHRTQSDLCKDTNCTDGVYVSSLYIRSEKIYCNAPSFPGQAPSQSGLAGADKSVLLLASNGYTVGLDQVQFRYWTPLDTADQARYAILGMIVLLVLSFSCFMQYKRRAMKNRKVISVPEEWKRPSIDAADEHRHQVGIRKYGVRKYDFRKTSCEQLGELGEGIGLYFQFLKYFGQTFTLLAM